MRPSGAKRPAQRCAKYGSESMPAGEWAAGARGARRVAIAQRAIGMHAQKRHTFFDDTNDNRDFRAERIRDVIPLYFYVIEAYIYGRA